MKEKKKLQTKSGQAAVQYSVWSLMPSLSFLSDTVEPRKTVTNYENFGIEHPVSIDALSPASSETFVDIHSAYDTQEQVHNMEDTNIRQTNQTEFCSPQFRSLPRPNSASSRSNSISPYPSSASPRPNSVSPRPIDAFPSSTGAPFIRTSNISRPESISPRPSSAPYLRDSVSPCSRRSDTVGSYSQQNYAQYAKRAKKQLPETRTDAVDQAILNLVEKRNSTDTMNSDDLFYLSISRDSQQLNVNAKLRLKALVLQALSQVVTEEQNKI
ncbi:putative protein TPRXL isoform X2 [Solenopsis invicta]|nr:putative protein TPRXL isoform X2 [Solenopsis invicta]XP_039311755.1 putative protein TPRXL isoform X2 [Solenopsis invicta]